MGVKGFLKEATLGNGWGGEGMGRISKIKKGGVKQFTKFESYDTDFVGKEGAVDLLRR